MRGDLLSREALERSFRRRSNQISSGAALLKLRSNWKNKCLRDWASGAPPLRLSPSVLTEQDDDTEQDGHQGSRAESRPRRERLGVAQLHVALAVAGAHSDGQGAGAALHRELSVRNDHRHVVDALLQTVVAVPPGQDPGRVVWKHRDIQLLRSDRYRQNEYFNELRLKFHLVLWVCF